MVRIQALLLLQLLVALGVTSSYAFLNVVAPPGTTTSAFSFLSSSTTSSQEEEDSSPCSFADLGLGPEALQAVQAQADWITPTAIQQLVIPKLLLQDSASVWCQAPTGSGKTLAYALPLLQKLRDNHKQARTLTKAAAAGGIASLVLVPTRELAAQIGTVISQLGQRMYPDQRLNIMVMTGGTPLKPQISDYQEYARRNKVIDVVVATPGRLVDVLSSSDVQLEEQLLRSMDSPHSNSRSIRKDTTTLRDMSSLTSLLDGLEYFVMDEADSLLRRTNQVEMDQVLNLLPDKVTTWLFSATFPPHLEPRVEVVLKRLGATQPLRISSTTLDRSNVASSEGSNRLQKRMDRVNVAASGPKLEQIGPASTIQFRSIRVMEKDRTQLLRRLVQEKQWGRVLVFVATRYAAEHVSRKLQRAGIQSAPLHGKLDQDLRSRQLHDLKQGHLQVLVATDLASRGLDVAGLAAVINYDIPRSTADFVHRVGRTGRAGKSGTAVTFLTPANEAHFDLIEKRHLPESAEREVLAGFEPSEDEWLIAAQATRMSTPGTAPSPKGLAHDRMFGGVKGRRKSKKDKIREQAAKEDAAK